MGTEKVNLAVIIKNPSNDAEFLLIKQAPPPKFNDPEYDSFQDSDLWDLPSAQLSPLGSSLSSSQVQIEANDNSLLEFLNQFDLDSAINQVFGQVGLEKATKVKWNLWKVVEEPEFGPGIPTKTVYIVGELEPNDGKLEDYCKWMSINGCADLLMEVQPHIDRIGPLVVVGLMNDSTQHANLNIPPTSRSLEYPPGVRLIPMRSRTAKPFHSTNLVVFVPGSSYDGFGGDNFIASGDALIIDPGCNSAMHKELEQIVTALPRKLVVFVTHHHHDHVDGLSIVQKCNPDATLVAHENTVQRIKKDDWSREYIPVVGLEEICVGGQRLRLISAPGHTDGHMALLHVSTNSLIVGDHCVGQGSALLDITSGGNMSDYFRTTYEFMDLSPHVLIPMHGRVNMWPKHMLCGYLKNRRNRESTILKAIQDGAKTLFDIVAYTYADVDRSLWIHAASNVRLHVDHLALQNNLPKDFSMQRFQSSCKLKFFSRWIWEYLCSTLSIKHHHLHIVKVLGAGAVAAVAALYSIRKILHSKKNV
ncbi:Glyoxylase [Handroanthus impetiginosus]|uniref:Glyoxylase n=1 Tax=Handroanthus impetiginosus TaxID=429701 RepID=A0A2G9HBV1_9LAMI|nr:Glyoxylase [Handroanthus impetiginosus]